MLDERQQFKVAFIMRCIENGFTTPEQITEIVKEAREKVAFSAIGSGIEAVKDLGVLGGTALLAAPPALGFLAGNILGQAGDLNDIDAEEVKKQELIDELRKNTERLRRNRFSAAPPR